MLSTSVLISIALIAGANAANYDTYPSVAHSASINGFADPIYAELPDCAKSCVSIDTDSTPCPYWDTGCLCVIAAFADSVADCVASQCSGSNVATVTSLATSICSSAGVPSPYWYIDDAAESSLESAESNTSEDSSTSTSASQAATYTSSTAAETTAAEESTSAVPVTTSAPATTATSAAAAESSAAAVESSAAAVESSAAAESSAADAESSVAAESSAAAADSDSDSAAASAASSVSAEAVEKASTSSGSESSATVAAQETNNAAGRNPTAILVALAGAFAGVVAML